VTIKAFLAIKTSECSKRVFQLIPESTESRTRGKDDDLLIGSHIFLESDYGHSRLDAIIGDFMASKFTKLEMQILEGFWQLGPSSVREILETFPARRRPAYTTIQTVVYRLERKKALRCLKRISNANIFEAAVTRETARRAFVDDVLALFGGRVQALMSHLVETGDLKIEDIKEAERTLRKLSKKETPR